MRLPEKNDRLLRLTAYGSVSVLLIVLLAHARLIGAGQWEADEYMVSPADIHAGYWHCITMLARWSPRPLPETLFYGYYLLVEHFHTPFIGPFLLGCWLLLAGSVIMGTWLNASVQASRFSLRILPALSLMAMFLLGHDVGEVFYWPQSAISYIPALAAITLVFFLPAGGTDRFAWVRSVALAVAALSCEMGAMFVACYCALQLLDEAVYGRTVKGQILQRAFWMLPLLAALGVLAVVVTHRLGAHELIFSDSLRHHLSACMGMGFLQFLGAVLDPTGYLDVSYDVSDMNNLMLMSKGLIVRLLWFIGFGLCWKLAYPSYHPQRAHLLFAVALALASYGSMAAADYQFGGLCCERHETLRQCFLALAVAALAAYCSPRLELRSPSHWALAPLLLLFPIGIFMLNRAPELMEDYAHYAQSIRAREKTWQSGLSPDSPAMLFYLAPSAAVANGTPYMTPGHYVLDAMTPENIAPVLRYFGKQSMTIIAPEK